MDITGYGVDFGLDQFTSMAELASTFKSKMIISVNDIPDLRKAFVGKWQDRWKFR